MYNSIMFLLCGHLHHDTSCVSLGKSIVQEYLHALHMEIKRNHAKEVIKKALEETEDLTPG